MIKTLIGKSAMLLFLCTLPVLSFADNGYIQVRPNDEVLTFVGVARRHLRQSDSIEAALLDAARKVAFYHSVSGEIVTHESGGALVGNSFISKSEITNPDDYALFLDELEYDSANDVFELDNAVFVRASYRVSSKIGISYTPAQNNARPQWIDRPPSRIGAYMSAVGFSGPLLYHSDTVVASYESAVISLIESSSTRIKVIQSETSRSSNLSTLSIASGTLNGFFVLDTWTDPATKSVWTLAIASAFTDNTALSDGYIAVDFNGSPTPEQTAARQPVPEPPIPENWFVNLPADTAATVYFWGFSGKSRDRLEAETKALQDAMLRISGYIFYIVENNYSEIFRYKNTMGRVIEESETINEFSLAYTRNMLEGIKAARTNVSANSDGTIEVQILVPVSVTDIQSKRDEIDRQMYERSVYFTEEITGLAPSLETIKTYKRIMALLSPLERFRVNFLGLERPRNLYSYLEEQLIILGNEVYTAHLVFYGNFSVIEKNNIFGALQNGLRNNGVSLQLTDSLNAYFKIIITGEEYITTYKTVRWEGSGLSLIFMQNNSLLESAYIFVNPQVSRDWLINRTVEGIREKYEFYQSIKTHL